jgi:DNA repair exonuclease SbcCD ATPase subunit
MTMGFSQLQCPACGAPIAISDSTETAQCLFCRSKLAVERHEDSATASLLKDLSTSVAEGQAKIEASLTKTLTQQHEQQQQQWREQQRQNRIDSLEGQLLTVQSEIRTLTRTKLTGHGKRELHQLRQQEAQLISQLTELTGALRENVPGQPANGIGCFSAIIVYMIVMFLLQAVGAEDIGAIFALLIGLGVFFYVRNAAAR